MNKYAMQFIAFLFILGLTAGSLQNPYTDNYLAAIEATAVPVVKQSAVYDQIVKAKQELDKPAIDARVDEVWKGIPGYNGLIVDEESSYKKMKKGSFDQKKLVFREVSPKVSLEDLPPVPIYKGNPEKPMVSFMVNVAWGNEYLPDMLKIFKKYNIVTTFFLDGSWVKKNPDLVKMIVEQGHEIGNHAYSHPDLKVMSSERTRKELSDTNAVIKATINKTPALFAPPSGSFNTQTIKVADELGMKTILWSVDTVDWKNPPPADMSQRVLSKMHPGALLLMHPTKSSLAGLETMIKGVKERGYAIGPVSQLLSEKRINVKEVQKSFD
ncbi:polysaccharide deacetylase family protein [Pseudalkalibacillus caeni]|uniref:NodB homology domain-containing protein n=1 Tax=Exobacillus caeni TaxID=2574798 RepID=A0A5R9F1E2_9BACL|nr:polysaccharide deacetylase family protein [Pseudalkalibacillus caeni]TLS37377.1 hypothetical protein FCL54_09490 [Pseudalkalibacillus caeni]